MSRYINVETVSFTDHNNRTVPVKVRRDIPDEQQVLEIDIKSGELLDEVANRPGVYGEYGEIQTYRIFDKNIVRLTEANFDLSKIKRLKIPL